MQTLASYAPLLLLLLACWSPCTPAHSQTRPPAPGPAHSPVRQANRVLLAADPEARLPLPGHVPSWGTPSADLGLVAGDQPIRLTFGISRAANMQQAFDQLLSAQQDPASPRFHHWLTPQQIGDQFGPTQHDLDALTAWLSAQGFHLDNITPSRVFVQASAPAALVSRALETSLHRYAIHSVAAHPVILQAPSAEPSIPAALAPVVSFIGGLTGVAYHTHLLNLPIVPIASDGTPPRAFSVAPPQAQPQAALHPALNVGDGSIHWIAPADFAAIYDLNLVYRSGINGSGQRIMIVGGSRLNPSDLTSWEKLSNLPPYQPNYLIGPGFTDPGQTDNDDMGEGTLDFERAHGTAPGAVIDMVIAANWLQGTTNADLILYAVNTVNDPILSLSFGACESEQTPAYIRHEDAVYSQAAAQGISVFVSSGDSGVAGCEPHGTTSPAVQTASINDLCASGSVTCVGGTQFSDTAKPAAYWSASNTSANSSALGYIPEGAWNEPEGNTPGTFVVSATGGGTSTIIAKPVWQLGEGVPANGFRNTPDLSFSASTHNAYFTCLAYRGADCTQAVTGFGGTSASAPSMAGISALLNQRLGGPQGNLNPMLYRIAAATPNAFHDATPATSGVLNCDTATPSTCNNSNPSPAASSGGIAGFALTPGYDLATGLGSLDVQNFLEAAARPQPTAPILPPPPPVPPAPPVISLLLAKSTLAVTAGASTTDAITIVSDHFAGIESLTCVVTPKASTSSANIPTCSFTPASITITSGGRAIATLLISSSKPVAAFAPGPHPFLGAFLSTSIAFCTLLLLLPHRSKLSPYRAQVDRARLLTTLFLIAASLALSGCGSGGTFLTRPAPTPPQSPTSAPTSPSVAYSITISADSDRNHPGDVGASATVELTIQ